MKVTTILNEKGGVSKTMSALVLAEGFARAGRRTLLIDADPQGGATKLMFDSSKYEEIYASNKTIATVLKDPKCVRECIWKTSNPNLDVIPSAGHVMKVMNDIERNPLASFPDRIKRALVGLDYDDVIIDNNPYFSLLAINTVVSADRIIIPSNIELGAVDAINETLEDINSVINQLDDAKPVECNILLTMIDRNSVDKLMSEQLRKSFEGNDTVSVFKTQIRTQKKPVKVAGFTHTSILDDKKSKVAAEYRALVDEVLGEERE